MATDRGTDDDSQSTSRTPTPRLPTQQSRSPSRPSTPQLRGRRYPSDLGNNPHHVPLHRRGTSNTYETLEDLLRDAGYKETRVVTPQADRIAESARHAQQSRAREPSTRSGVGAVVGFLSGLLPGSTSSDGEPVASSSKVFSPLASPTPRRHHLADQKTLPPLHQRASPPPLAHKSELSHHPLSTSGESIAVRPRPSAANVRTYADAQQARAYLRHMASAPNIQRRRTTGSSKSAHAQSSTAHVVSLNDEPPPLPHGWLDAVTRAIRGAAAPNSTIAAVEPGPAALADNTNRATTGVDNTNRRPPRLAPMRARSSTGKVTSATVTCRSAPGSRSSSRVRGLASVMDGARGKRRRGDRPDVPVLADTRAEGDLWTEGGEGGDGGGDEDGESSDGEGELDLAQMLVPPKRQHSIRSLRRHLDPARTQSLRVVGSRRELSRVRGRDGGEEDEEVLWVARGRRGTATSGEGDEGEVVVPRPVGRRRGLPSTWGQGGR